MRPDELIARVQKMPATELLALERSGMVGADEYAAVVAEIKRRGISQPSLPSATPVAAAMPTPRGAYVCQQCGFVGAPATVTPGSGCMTLFLLIWLIVPGILYSIWRHTATYKVCPTCQSRAIIPADSPVARRQLGR